VLNDKGQGSCQNQGGRSQPDHDGVRMDGTNRAKRKKMTPSLRWALQGLGRKTRRILRMREVVGEIGITFVGKASMKKELIKTD